MPKGVPKNLPLWVCPKCDLHQRCLGNAVGHLCPSNKTRWVNFQKVEEETDGK